MTAPELMGLTVAAVGIVGWALAQLYHRRYQPQQAQPIDQPWRQGVATLEERRVDSLGPVTRWE